MMTIIETTIVKEGIFVAAKEKKRYTTSTMLTREFNKFLSLLFL